jgi:hypothetical protein
MVTSSVTWSEARASAFAVQTCSSRKPLPTPPPFEYPILYCAPAALGYSADADSAGAELSAAGALSAGACDAGAVVAPPPLLHAAAISASAPWAATARAFPNCFMNSTPPCGGRALHVEQGPPVLSCVASTG